jgi:hypothetical protein
LVCNYLFRETKLVFHPLAFANMADPHENDPVVLIEFPLGVRMKPSIWSGLIPMQSRDTYIPGVFSGGNTSTRIRTEARPPALHRAAPVIAIVTGRRIAKMIGFISHPSLDGRARAWGLG